MSSKSKSNALKKHIWKASKAKIYSGHGEGEPEPNIKGMKKLSTKQVLSHYKSEGEYQKSRKSMQDN